LIDCHYTLNQYGNFPPQTKIEYDQIIQPKIDKFLHAKVVGSIFLANELNEIFSQVLGADRQVSLAIWLNMPDGECPVKKDSYPTQTKNVDWVRFGEVYDNNKLPTIVSY